MLALPAALPHIFKLLKLHIQILHKYDRSPQGSITFRLNAAPQGHTAIKTYYLTKTLLLRRVFALHKSSCIYDKNVTNIYQSFKTEYYLFKSVCSHGGERFYITPYILLLI
jgi:hypothetical protein